MKLAVTTLASDITLPFQLSRLEGDFSTRLRKAAALAYDGVELVVLEPAQLDAAAVQWQVKDRGLEIAAIASGAQASLSGLTLLAADEHIREQAYQRLIELIHFAAGCGAPLVTIGSFRGRVSTGSREQAREYLVQILRKACMIASAVGVRLVIEPLNRYETDLLLNAAEGLALIEDVGHSHLGLLLDTFHMNIEEASFHASIEQAAHAGRLWHVHIAESNRLSPGEGHLPFDEIFAAIHRSGYVGYCSAELLNRPTADIAATKTIEYCRPYMTGGR